MEGKSKSHRRAGPGRPPKSGNKNIPSENTRSGRAEYAWHPWWTWQLLRRNAFYVEAVKKFEAAITQDTCPTLKLIWDDIKLHCDLVNTTDFDTLRRGYVELESLKVTPMNRQRNGEFVLNGKVENSSGADFPKVQHFEQLLSLLTPKRLNATEKALMFDFQALYGDVVRFPIDPKVEAPQTGLLHTLFIFRPLTLPTANLNQAEESAGVRVVQVNLRFSDDFIRHELNKFLTIQRKSLPRWSKAIDKNQKLPDAKNWEDMAKRTYAYDLHKLGKKTVEIRGAIKATFVGSSFGNASIEIPRYIKKVEELIAVFDPFAPF